MNSEQVRELADRLEPMAAAPVFEQLDIPGAVALLHQCAEQRPCTCHPDDNPPVPCAQKYALNECRAASEPTEAQIEQHPDDAAVDRFAAAMKAKLAEKRAEGRGGWDDPEQCSTTYLATLLRSHVEKGDPLDVGNFAMMLWHRGGATNEAVDPGIPDLRLTEAQITAAAKELCQCHAEGRGADPDDEWKAYCEQFRTEAARVLRAALAAKEKPE